MSEKQESSKRSVQYTGMHRVDLIGLVEAGLAATSTRIRSSRPIEFGAGNCICRDNPPALQTQDARAAQSSKSLPLCVLDGPNKPVEFVSFHSTCERH